MANYESVSRSNYFKVKDNAAFELWCKDLDLEFVEEKGAYAIFGGRHAGWPSDRPADNDDFEDIDFVQELSQHLHKDYVAVLMEAGNEKSRYVIGHAIAVNSKGEIKAIDLCDIYDLAKPMGKIVTQAEY